MAHTKNLRIQLYCQLSARFKSCFWNGVLYTLHDEEVQQQNVSTQ